MSAARAMSAGLFVVDDRQRVVEWSEGAAAITGIPADRAVGRPCYEVLRGCDPSGGPVCRRNCPTFESLRRGRLSSRSVLVLQAPSGEHLTVRCELTALPRQPGGAVGWLRECGAGRTAARTAAGGAAPPGVVRDLSALATLATSLATSPIELALEPALGIVREATGADSAEVFLADPGRREVTLAAYRGPFPAAFFQILRFEAGDGYPGLVLARRAPITTTALDRDDRYRRTLVKEKGYRSYACAPLLGPEGPVGVLSVAWRRADVDAEGILRVLTWAGTVVGAALHACLLRLRETLSAAALGADVGEGGLDRLLQTVLARALELGEADDGALLLLDPSAAGPTRLVTAGAFACTACPALHPGAASGCAALDTRRGVVLHGARRSWPPGCRRMRPAGAAKYCVPILVDGRPIGLIQLAYRRRAPSPPTHGLGLLLGMADGAGHVIGSVLGRMRESRWVEPLSRPRPSPEAGADGAGGAPAAGAAARGPRGDAEAADAPELSVRCLGPFELRRRGLLLPPDAFRRRKALALLKILLVRAGRPVPRDTLIELLWPEADPEAGARRLHVVVHALRRALEPPARGPRWTFVRGGTDFYTFDTGGRCRLDIEEFEASVALGRMAEQAGVPEEAARAYGEAVRLYRGDLLEGEPDGAWCEVERAHLRESFLGALTSLAALRVQAGDLEGGIEQYRRALRVDPLREELHRRLIECLWRAGRRDEALRDYRVCRDLLRQELGIGPLPETERLVERVRREPPR